MKASQGLSIFDYKGMYGLIYPLVAAFATQYVQRPL